MRPGGFNLTVTAYNSWIYLLLNDIPSVHIRPLENVSMSLHQTAENSEFCPDILLAYLERDLTAI